MGNFLKSFALNKTTVTILGIIASAAVLIIGYIYRTNNITAMTTVYYVGTDVKSNEQLSEEKIKKTKVVSSLLTTNPNLVTDLGQIRDKNGEFFFVNYGYYFPQGSLLTKSALIAKDDKSDEKLYHNLKEGETIFKIDVDLDSTQGNSVQKGNAMDIYVDGKDNQEVIYTKFIENLKIIDVVDSKWSTTKDNKSEQKQSPRYIVTAVDEDMFVMLSKITDIGNYSFKLIPVDTRKPYVENTESKIVNEKISEIIEANTAY